MIQRDREGRGKTLIIELTDDRDPLEKENIIEEQTKKYARCDRRNKKWLKGMQRDVFSSFSKLQ